MQFIWSDGGVTLFEKHENIKRILNEIVPITVLLGFLGFGDIVWSRTGNLYIVTIYFMVIIIIVLSFGIGLIHSQLEEMKHFKGDYFGMLGTFFYNTEEPINDTKHHLIYAEAEYTIQNDDGMYKWVLKGFNTLDEPSSNLTVKIAGVSPVDEASSLGLAVKDMATGELYNDKQIILIKNLPHLKVFDLKFPKPLARNDFFDIEIRCRWDNNFPLSKKHDYVFFGAGSYWSEGVDKFVGRLVCDVPITYSVIEKMDSGVLIKEQKQPKAIDTNPKHYVLEWDISNPHKTYILRFTKDTKKK